MSLAVSFRVQLAPLQMPGLHFGSDTCTEVDPHFVRTPQICQSGDVGLLRVSSCVTRFIAPTAPITAKRPGYSPGKPSSGNRGRCVSVSALLLPTNDGTLPATRRCACDGASARHRRDCAWCRRCHLVSSLLRFRCTAWISAPIRAPTQTHTSYERRKFASLETSGF